MLEGFVRKRIIKRFWKLQKSFKKASEDKTGVCRGRPLKQETEEKAREDKLDVLFVGLSDVVEQWLQAMDVFVFPSLFEGLPLRPG
ncbi:MAG: glycosyltransferase [Mediterraneibacter gnavus]